MANKKITSIPLSEKQVTEQVIGFLKSEGFVCFRMQAGTVRGLTGGSFIKLNPKGTPDWVAISGCYVKGYAKTIFLEMKRSKGGKLSPDQISWHTEAAKDNLAVFVVSDYKEFRKQYESLFVPNGLGNDITIPVDML